MRIIDYKLQRVPGTAPPQTFNIYLSLVMRNDAWESHEATCHTVASRTVIDTLGTWVLPLPTSVLGEVSRISRRLEGGPIAVHLHFIAPFKHVLPVVCVPKAILTYFSLAGDLTPSKKIHWDGRFAFIERENREKVNKPRIWDRSKRFWKI